MKLELVGVALLASVATICGDPKNYNCDTKVSPPGVEPQSGPFPYEILVSRLDLKFFERTTITIRGKDGETFKEFLIVAKSPNRRLGYFSPANNESQDIYCRYGGRGIIQTNSADKKEVVVRWNQSALYNGTINFYVTVMKDPHTIWVNQKSQDVTISDEDSPSVKIHIISSNF